MLWFFARGGDQGSPMAAADAAQCRAPTWTTVTASTCPLMDSACEMPHSVSLETPVTGTTTAAGLPSGLPGISPRPRAPPGCVVVVVNPDKHRDERGHRGDLLAGYVPRSQRRADQDVPDRRRPP
jgi:hypothetical protein